MVNTARVRTLKYSERKGKGPVVYWMSRDQRVHNNWAFLYALNEAATTVSPFYVVFSLVKSYPNANMRHYHFMIEGLREVEATLKSYGIPFYLLLGSPFNTIPEFINESGASMLVSDFDPLRWKMEWKQKVNDCIKIPHFEVDAHNIVPCWYASNKLEFGAYTLRPRIKKLLPEFLDNYPVVSNFTQSDSSITIDWNKVASCLQPDSDVKPVYWLRPGENAAQAILKEFLSEKLNGYAQNRNNPLLYGQSNLSPYLHFGHISAQAVTQSIISSSASEPDKSAFLEELIVRRELSDNFCFYSPSYDSTHSFHNWAQETHAKHGTDEREYVYTASEFENSLTHDKLWNAAQTEMVITGKMHGYMRMYWAKKILEWTSSPEEAMGIAIYLNDKYSLDGRDPNGYAGIAWSIGGVHDRAWNERPVFGKIRYMNYNGCRRKFDVDGYVNKITKLINP